MKALSFYLSSVRIISSSGLFPALAGKKNQKSEISDFCLNLVKSEWQVTFNLSTIFFLMTKCKKSHLVFQKF